MTAPMTTLEEAERAAFERDAVVCTESWAGRVETKVKVLLLSSTLKSFRVRYMEDAIKRKIGDVCLVPRHSVRFTDGMPALELTVKQRWSK
jgi:hypothetical protein